MTQAIPIKTLKISIFCFLIAACHAATQPQAPNIIYILADDLGYGDVNYEIESLDRFKNPHIDTPNLARLAKQSVVFTDQYSTSPICSPARAGLLTGKIPNRCNIDLFISDEKDNDRVFLSGKEVTIAEILRDSGYSTAIFGKWHLNGADWEDKEAWTGWTGSFPKQQGFQAGLVSKENPHLSRKLAKNSQKNPGDFFTLDGEPAGIIEGFSSEIITTQAINWIAETKKTKNPFFLYLPYDAVHEFIVNPDEFNNMYKTGDYDKDQYYANVTYLDYQIGRLLDSLGEMGLRDNTIIFFSSDNGPEAWRTNGHSGRSFGTSYPLHGQKRQLLEGGIRVPGLISWLGTIKPGVSRYPNSHYDILPTLTSLAGTKLPEDLKIDGIDLSDHILKGAQTNRTRPLYWQFERRRQNWETTGKEYNRRFAGNKRIPDPTPRVVIRDGDFVLHGYHDKEHNSLPDAYKLFNVVEDHLLTTDLSGDDPQRFEQMIISLKEIHKDVNQERIQRSTEIKDRVNQNP